ncbi:Tetratricopeptide repeat protein 1 [Sesamum angolense]|uniref:Tetratricopeptide repeat protein 1 n=1 Tax=Sesamum angolense TaxID=2727404 RepID=A0AAE2BPC5_9LAMI|nr:Tetratricopeptide repeat protein 1 [Sesamum angolense]
MAVIEDESSGENDLKSRPNSAAAQPGYSSDGYETASDTELTDAVTEPENHSRRNDGGTDQHNDVSSVKNGDDGVSREVKEDEQQEKTETVDVEANEKALARANDAKLQGNSFFKAGQYEEALTKYEFAINIAPDGPSSSEVRSMCHANRAACFFKMTGYIITLEFYLELSSLMISISQNINIINESDIYPNFMAIWPGSISQGKYEETAKECTKALELNPTYIKALLRRGEAREKLEQYEESIADMTKILELDPSNDQARRTIIRLKPLAEEKREKMKEEMIGKLKEMGNSILGRFGMSVDNFKAVKDPNTGSYSVQFQR